VSTRAVTMQSNCGGDTSGPSDAAECSFGQERLWFLDQLGEPGAGYVEPVLLRVAGPLDEAALERSFTELVRRHASLRTRFGSRDGRPVQIVDPPRRFELERSSLANLEASAQDAELERLGKAAMRERLSLTAGPLFRVALIRLNDHEHALLLRVHHIVSDGWSMGILARELAALYAAYAAGAASPLQELEMQYADHAARQRDRASQGAVAEQLGYWKEALRGIEPLELPTDRPRPETPSFSGSDCRLALPKELVARLRELARREGVTLFMLLLAAYQLLLSRWSGQRDIAVGSPAAGRTRRDLEGVVGFFVNTLVLRSTIAPDAPWRNFLRQVKHAALDAYSNQDVPFDLLVQELRPRRDLARHPIFQAMFAFLNIAPVTFDLPGLRLRRIDIEYVAAQFDLTLAIYEDAAALNTIFKYAAELFDAATVARMARDFERILDRIVGRPESLLGELVRGAERERAPLAEWGDAPQPPCPVLV
jgi:hypothetical protein